MALSMQDLPPKQQWVVALVLCAMLSGVYYFQFYGGYAEQIGQTRAEIDAAQIELLELQRVAASLPELREELRALDDRLRVLSHILPEEYETAELLRGVGTLAAQSNLEIRDLEFRDPEPGEFYATSPIELELVGSYHDLARFFDRIGKFARIINIGEVEIEAVDGGMGASTVSATITAATFIFLEDDAEALDADLRELLGE